LKEVAMHEAGHMIQHVWQNDGAIVSRMLGDSTKPGLVRNPDGTLHPEFKAWAGEYNNLRPNDPLDLNDLAIEYYTDQGVQTLLEDTLKGNLYKESRKTPLRRAVEGSFRTLLNATPIVKNLHFKMGGATDAGGRMVMGTGLLADGFRELPEVKAMVRQMYRETTGKPTSARPQKIVDIKSDNPKHYGADPYISMGSKDIIERGEKLPKGVLVVDKNGNGEGMLTSDHFKRMEEGGAIDEGRFGEALLIQSEIEAATKHGMLLVNKPIKQGRSEQFGGLTENYVVPTKWVLKKGRLYLEAMDLRQLEKNVDRAVRNKIAKELNLTRKKIYEDIEKSVEIQNRGQSTDAYYQSVDPKNWQRRKNFINSVQGQQTTRQLGINPMMQKVSPDLVTGIYRTFAFDRLQSAIKTSGDVVIPYGPTSYYSLRDNLMPQSPRFNRNGELIYENKEQKTGRIPSKQGVAIDQQAAVQAQEGVAQRQGQGQEGQVRLMPQTKLDSDYMKAVESGDLKAQQRMVDEAQSLFMADKLLNEISNARFSSSKQTKITQDPVEFVLKGRAFRGSRMSDQEFHDMLRRRIEYYDKDPAFRASVDKEAEKMRKSLAGASAPGVQVVFVNKKGDRLFEILGFGKKTSRREVLAHELFHARANGLISHSEFMATIYGKFKAPKHQNPTVRNFLGAANAALNLPVAAIYEIATLPNRLAYIASLAYFAKAKIYNIKNRTPAAPVVYDADGKVIPLSKRFDVSSKDTRHMPKGKPKASRINRFTPRKSETKYRNPTLAKSIQFGISGQSREREQTK